MSETIAKISMSDVNKMGSAVENVFSVASERAEYSCCFDEGIINELEKRKLSFLKPVDGLKPLCWKNSELENDGQLVDLTKLMALVSFLTIDSQIREAEEKHKSLIGFMDIRKNAVFYRDFEILHEIMRGYKYEMNSPTSCAANLCHTKVIKRYVLNDMEFYKQRVERYLEPGKVLKESVSATKYVKKIMNRFACYKLVLYEYSYLINLEMLLSQNYERDFLKHLSDELGSMLEEYNSLYLRCVETVQRLKERAIKKHFGSGVSKATKATGTFIGKMPYYGVADELLISAGENLENSIQTDIERTMEFFEKNRQSELEMVLNHIDLIEVIARKPVKIQYNSTDIEIYSI